MAKPTIIPIWNTAETNVTEPDAAHKLDGWLAPAGVPEKPPFQYFNFWQNSVYKWLNQINQNGVLVYDALTDYVADEAWVQGSDGNLYACRINNGPSSSVVNPVGDGTGTWVDYINSPPLPLWYKEGLTLSYGGVTQLDIDEGEARDDGDTDDIVLSTAAFNKTLSAFSAGSGNGSLDTGSIASNTWYNVWLIKNLTTAAVDVLISVSLSPSMPSGFTKKRWIGAILTNGSSQITDFTQLGNQFLWDTVPLDVSAFSATANTYYNHALSVPDNIQVTAIANIGMTAGATATAHYFFSPDVSDQLASLTVAPLGNTISSVSGSSGKQQQLKIRTNTNQEIRGVSSQATTVNIATIGWETDFRI